MPEPIQANPAAETVTPPAGGGQIPPGTPQPGGAAPQSLTIDGVQYTPDQVKELVKAKADYDRFQPEFTQRSQILSDPQKFREYGQQKYPDLFKAPTTPTEEEQQITQAVELLRSKGQFVTREEAVKAAREEMALERMADQFRQENTKLSKDWDGKDGKPKYDAEAVKQHMLDNGFPNLTSAFRDLHYDALQEYHAASKGKQPKAPVIAAPGGGGPAPVTPDNGPDLNKRGAVKKDFENFLATRSE
jgi:hypothetical protein